MEASSGRQDTPEVALPGLLVAVRPRVRGVLFRHRIPIDDAEDLVQSALLLLLVKWPEVREPGAWLLGTLEKRCRRYWREWRQKWSRHGPIEEVAAQLLIPAEQEQWEIRADLNAWAKELSAQAKKILALRYQFGLGEKELAMALGLRPNSVQKSVSRALVAMRRRAGLAGGRRHRWRPEETPKPLLGPARGDEPPPLAVAFRMSRRTWERVHHLATSEGISIQQLLFFELSLGFKRRGLPPLES